MSINNVSKIFTYIYPITKEKIVLGNNVWNPVNSIYLRPSIFSYDECVLCGKCCIHEDLIYLPFEVENMRKALNDKNIDESIHKLNSKGYENIEELVNALEEFEVIINDNTFTLFKCKLSPNQYHFEDRGDLLRCHFNLPTEDNRLGCGIHTVSSLTCKMPHIRFYHNSKALSTSIGHGEYGRNWALKCPAKIEKSGIYEPAIDTAISNFELLAKYCDYFRIDTWVSEILEKLYLVKRDVNNIEVVCDKNIVHAPDNRRRLF